MTISTATASFEFTSTVIMQWESTTSSYYSSYYQQTLGLQGASVTAKYSYLEQVEYTQVFIIHFSLIVTYTYSSISIVEVAQEALYTSSSKETYSSTLVENIGVDLAVDNVEYVSPPTNPPTKKPFFIPTAKIPSSSLSHLETDQPTPSTLKTVTFSSQMVISVSSTFTFSSTVIEQWESATSTYYTYYYQETSGLQECSVTVKYKSIEQVQYTQQYAIYFSLVVQYQFTSVLEVADVAEEVFYTSESKESYSAELGSILRNAVQVDTVKYSTPQPTMRPYASPTSKPSISFVNITGSLSSQPTTLKPTPNQPGDSTHAPSLNSTTYPSSSETVYQLASLIPTRKPATEIPSPLIVSSLNITASPTNNLTALQAVTSAPKPAERTPSPSFFNSTTAYPTNTETALTVSPTVKPLPQTSAPKSFNPTAYLPTSNETALQVDTSSPSFKPTTQIPSPAFNSTTSYPTNTETVLQFATLSPTSKPVPQTPVSISLNPTAFPISNETALQVATSSPTFKPTTQMPSPAFNSSTSHPTKVLQFATLSPTSKPGPQTSVPSSFNPTAYLTTSNETALQVATTSPTLKPTTPMPSPAFNSTTSYPTKIATQFDTLSPTSKPVPQTAVPNSLNPTAFPTSNETALQAATSSPTPKPTTQIPSYALNSTTSNPSNTETATDTIHPTSKPIPLTPVPISSNPTAYLANNDTSLQVSTPPPSPKPSTQVPFLSFNSTTVMPSTAFILISPTAGPSGNMSTPGPSLFVFIDPPLSEAPAPTSTPTSTPSNFSAMPSASPTTIF
jgi:hypothetical protein